MKQFFFTAELISIQPEIYEGDLVITKDLVEKAMGSKTPKALIIRTLPNLDSKRHLNYSSKFSVSRFSSSSLISLIDCSAVEPWFSTKSR